MRRAPADLLLRGFRVFVAFWLIVAPFLLGFGGTFAQRQDTVAGLMLLPIALIGLLVPGTRVLFLVIGAWLVLSPSFSYEYAAGSVPMWHDRILGLLCLFIGALPLRRESARDEVILTKPETDTPALAPGEKVGWSYLHRRPVTFR